jgi:hypothetical protein
VHFDDAIALRPARVPRQPEINCQDDTIAVDKLSAFRKVFLLVKLCKSGKSRVLDKLPMPRKSGDRYHPNY